MSFYPINPDTAIESFILIDSERQIEFLGRTYNFSELVPLNYRSVMNKIITESFNYVPLREYVYIYPDPKKAGEISNERDNGVQSSTLAQTFANLSNYYNQLLEELQVAAGVITEIKTDLLPNPDITGNPFFITHKLKVEWFVVHGSLFS